MSRTDKDNPWRVRKARGEEIYRHCPWHEKGSPPKAVKLAKRVARKARRRNPDAHISVVRSLTQTFDFNMG